MRATIPTPSDASSADPGDGRPASAAERARILADPGFGRHFTDHMVIRHWSAGAGWGDPAVQHYGPIALNPASAVLHYAQEIFEGLKAYRHPDGSIHLFRAEMNARRFQRSARRMALPPLPEDDFIHSVQSLAALDADWVPDTPGASLYLRPFMFAEDEFLGMHPADRVAYCLIATPAGAYFSDQAGGVKIWLATDYSRAGKGGTGAAKTGGNYAASLLPQAEAYRNGCAQALFLDSMEGRYLEELGAMNIVLVYQDGTLATPASESILDGITCDSVLQLAEGRGHRVERRKISIDEWRDGAAAGEITEAFACGTAAVVTPIAELRAPGFTIEMPRRAGGVGQALRRELTDIQYGRAEDVRGWLTRVPA